MITNLYSIRDIKNDYSVPFAAANDEIAVRMYKATAMDKDSNLAMFPADFELWRIGSYNTMSAQLEAEAYPIAINGDNSNE